MRPFIVLSAVAILIAGFLLEGAAAFTSRNDKPPAGDCGALVARYGADGVWFGRYSGFMSLDDKGREVPFWNQGCFASEAACRAWQNDNMSFTRGGSMRYTTCTPGVPARYR